MKVSQMLEREDFYGINQRTLDGYYKGGEGKTSLYIYPDLNAIVTKNPSRNVRKYLLCEYTMRSGAIKKVLVSGYVRLCLASKGIMAKQKIHINAEISDETLIYPCNRKYRIFDFENKTVEVILKDGFADSEMKHEIEFRSKEWLPPFVPGLVSWSKDQYKELIINGRPLARITEGFEKYRDKAYQLICDYRKLQTVSRGITEYNLQLEEKISSLITDKVKNQESLNEVVHGLSNFLDRGTVELTFSHGDLQTGNIWVENGTDNIYIIDWESWGTRSEWYDKAILYDGLRPDGLRTYFQREIPDEERAVVLLEDIIFQLTELNNLPSDFGEKQFEDYLYAIQEQMNVTNKCK